jgi:2-alkyl-3-oxoalkanoate reductase
MRIAVTGASGFVGGAVLQELARRGHEAIPIVRRTSLAGARVVAEWSENALTAALAGADAVIHAASVIHRRDAPLSEYTAFNVHGTERLLAAARNAGSSRFVYVSSVKVYGEQPSGIVTESTATPADLGYAGTKLEAEQRIFECASSFSRGASALRLVPVYGVGDKGNVRTMIANAARRTLVLPGGGRARKSIVHVDVVARALTTAAENAHQGVYLVANRHAPSVRELADEITSALGQRRAPWVPVAPLAAATALLDFSLAQLRLPRRDFASLVHKSQLPTQFSAAKLESVMGVDCNTDLTATIREEVAWWRALPRSQR